MAMQEQNKGFTLVELIVVITILAILGSIAFVSLQGYGKSARDSARIADIGQFRSGIEIFQVEAGVYPMPDNVDNSILVQSNPVNYPGTTGELVSNIARLSDAISDPATLEEYSYAIEGNKKSYQLTYSLEDDGSASILKEAHAADFVETVVVGNYNGVFAKTETGAMLTMPSLFAKHSTTGDVDYTVPTALDFTIPGETTPVSYTPVAITSYTDTEDLITQIQSGYDNTVDASIVSLEKVSEVNVLVASDTSSQETFESGYLGQITTTSGGGSTPTLTGWRVLDPNCDIDDIVIGTQTWAGCNSTLGNGFEYGQTDADIGTNNYSGSVPNCYDYNGNNTAICTKGDITMASSSKANIWYSGTNSNGDSEFNAIWGKFYTFANASSACPTGRHLPSDTEWTTLENTINGSTCRTGVGWECTGLGWNGHNAKTDTNNLANALKVPLAGFRNTNRSSFHERGYLTFLWSSTSSSTTMYYRRLDWDNSTVLRSTDSQDIGFSVRCIKD